VNEDNLSRGYVALYRSLLDNPIFTKYPLAYFKIFVYCLLKAAYKPKTYQGIDIPVGSFISSSIEIAAQCGVTRDQVRGSIEALTKAHVLATKTTNKFTLYTVENFERYQNGWQGNPQQSPNKAPTLPQKTPTNNKEEIRITDTEPQSAIAAAVVVAPLKAPKARKAPKPKPELPPDFFEEFWAIVWYKVGKKDAKAAWDRIVKDEAGGRRLIALAIQQGPILKDQAIGGGRNPLYPSTWLNKERFEDELLLPGFEPSDPAEEAAKQKRILAAINRDRAKEGLPPQESL